MIELAHCPSLMSLCLDWNCKDLRELYLYDLPALADLTVGDYALERLRLPGAEDRADAMGEVDAETGCPQVIDTEMPTCSPTLRTFSFNASRHMHRLDLPAEMPALKSIVVKDTQLASISLPRELPPDVRLTNNRLTSLSIAPDQPRLQSLDVADNQLTALTLGDCPNLDCLILCRNPLGRLTLGRTPALRWLDAAFTDVLSWRELALSNPEVLEFLSVQWNLAAELKQLRVHFPGLTAFEPFIVHDVDLSALLQWRPSGDIDPSRRECKRARLCGQLFVMPPEDELLLCFAMNALPGVGGLVSRAHEFTMNYHNSDRWSAGCAAGTIVMDSLKLRRRK